MTKLSSFGVRDLIKERLLLVAGEKVSFCKGMFLIKTRLVASRSKCLASSNTLRAPLVFSSEDRDFCFS